MSEVITGAAGVFDNTATVPTDTDLASGASLKTPFQRLLSNAKYLYDKVMTGGVEAVRSVANTAALKALTGMVNGATAMIPGQGIYVYVDPSAVTEALPFIVSPTVGTGQWISCRKGVFATYGAALTGANFTTASSSNVDITGMSVSVLATNPGDVLLLDAALGMQRFSGADPADASGSLWLTDGASVVGVGGTVDLSGSQRKKVSLVHRYVVVTGGTVVVTAKAST